MPLPPSATPVNGVISIHRNRRLIDPERGSKEIADGQRFR